MSTGLTIKNVIGVMAFAAWTAISVTVAPAPLYAQPPEPATVAAPIRSGSVALMPVVNLSGEKDARQREDQIKKAEEELNKQFRDRGYTLVPRETIDRALTDTKIDLTDEEYQNRATLFRIGNAVGAEYVVFVVITDVDQWRGDAPLTGKEMVGKAKTKTWLLRVPDGGIVLNAVRQESQARSNILPGLDSGARLIRKSVEGAVRDTLKSAWKELSAPKS